MCTDTHTCVHTHTSVATGIEKLSFISYLIVLNYFEVFISRFCVNRCCVCMNARASVEVRGHSGPLELESQMLVSCHMGAGNRARVLGRAADALHHGVISPALFVLV